MRWWLGTRAGAPQKCRFVLGVVRHSRGMQILISGSPARASTRLRFSRLLDYATHEFQWAIRAAMATDNKRLLYSVDEGRWVSSLRNFHLVGACDQTPDIRCFDLSYGECLVGVTARPNLDIDDKRCTSPIANGELALS